MMSQQPVQITIRKASNVGDHMVFKEWNVKTANRNLHSLGDSVNPTLHTSSSLNALCLKHEDNDSDGKRTSSVGSELCCCDYDHDVMKKPQHRKLLKVRDDLDLLRTKVKETGTKLSRSLSSLRINLQSSKKLKKKKQKIKVEYIDNESADRLCPQCPQTDNEDMLDFPDHNYSTSLIITDLCDGCFGAQICVEALPRGDLTIRIRNYKMEIVVGRRPSLVADNHRITYPLKYGDIDIPIYVNPATLCFEMDDDENILYMYGHTKGYHGSSRSSLANSPLIKKRSLPRPSSDLYHSDISLTDKTGHLTVQEKSPNRNSLTVCYTSGDSFRKRALTQ